MTSADERIKQNQLVPFQIELFKHLVFFQKQSQFYKRQQGIDLSVNSILPHFSAEKQESVHWAFVKHCSIYATAHGN